jgi:hypothetical protein
MTHELTCEERIAERHEDRRKAFLRCANALGSNASDEFKQRAEENTEALCLDVGFIVKVQLSTGGPADWYELRFNASGEPEGATYHFSDWFDHAEEECEPDEVDAVLSRFGFEDTYILREIICDAMDDK